MKTALTATAFRILKFWSNLTHLGVPAGAHPLEYKPIIVSNSITIAGIIVMMGYSAVMHFSGFPSFLMFINLAWVLLLAKCLVLNHLGWFGTARALGLTYANLMILTFVIITGHQYGAEEYFYLTTVLPFFVYGRKDAGHLIVFCAVSMALYAFQEWYLLHHQPLVPLGSFAPVFRYLSKGAFFITLLLSILYLSIESHMAEKQIEEEREKSDRLLANILPGALSNELKMQGFVRGQYHESVTVLFTDFVGFTRAAEAMKPDQLVEDLDFLFSRFDDFAENHRLEKLKTIGDAYMCAGGLPYPSRTHAVDCCLLALEILRFMEEFSALRREKKLPVWAVRIGINSGPVMAGVIGKKKFAYDVWGDTVNTASRLETAGSPGKINISESTWKQVGELFECRYRGSKSVKNKGRVKMYYLTRIRKEFSHDAEGAIANENFYRRLSELTGA